MATRKPKTTRKPRPSVAELALATIVADCRATYEAIARHGGPTVSIGQFRRLAGAEKVSARIMARRSVKATPPKAPSPAPARASTATMLPEVSPVA